MTNYFLCRLARDGLPGNKFKDLNSHAFPLYEAGHIQSVFVLTGPNYYMFKCVCLPEMRKDVLYNVNLTLDNNGEVLSAECGCAAGLGPTGNCKHISALCYVLEKFCRIRSLRSHNHAPRYCKPGINQERDGLNHVVLMTSVVLSMSMEGRRNQLSQLFMILVLLHSDAQQIMTFNRYDKK